MPHGRAAGHDLERAVPYLLARTGAGLGNAFARAIKPHGLSLVEWRVCASLSHQSDQTLSQLVVNASMDMSGLSRLIDRLIARGYAARERSEVDGRALSLALTPSGAALTRSLVPTAKLYERTALDGFSASEVTTLRTMLNRIYANARALP